MNKKITFIAPNKEALKRQIESYLKVIDEMFSLDDEVPETVIRIIKGRSVGPTTFLLNHDRYDELLAEQVLKPITKEPYYKRFDKNSKFRNCKKL